MSEQEVNQRGECKHVRPKKTLRIMGQGICALVLLLVCAVPAGQTQAGSEVNLEAKPWITVSAPADCSSENIEIPFVLYHDQSRPTNIYVQHSLDGGNTWSWSWTTRDIMECMRNLASAPNGVQHFFPWYSARQAPCNLYENVRVRILPWNSTENGAWASTEDFCMDNLLQITWLSNYGATRTNRFQIPIYYRLVDCTGEATNIYCKYSIDGGNTWNWAWQAPGGEGQTNLSTSPEGVLHTFMWDAARNLPDSHYPDVRFAILPYNTKGMSGFWKSSPFEVINSRAPWVSLYTPENPAQGEVVRVYMRVMDYQSLPTNVRGWYSVDGGEVWWEATSPDGDNLLSNLASSPAGVLQYFPWDAPSDLGEGMFGNVKFAVSADNPNGEGDREETASFKIGIPVIEERTIILRGNVRLELIRIPQGDFQMGSPDTERNRTDREGPLHTVNISYDSYMGKYEVTQSQWEAVMGKGNWPGTSPTSELGRGDSYPMYYVSWNDAINFIATLNKHITATSQGPLTIRLPSEAEWEYACRSATQTRFHFGASLSMADECEDDGIRSQYMWYCGNNKPDGTKPVGQKRPNAFGLYDMSGNVYEWCEDDYHDIYTGAPVGGSAWIEQPRNATRIIRGGYWGSDAAWCRSATRGSHAPIYRGNYTGFRVAADKQEAVPTPTPAPGDFTIMLPENVPLEMVRIPAGSFQMGSPSTERGRQDHEGPLHTVNIAYDFYMGKTKVTQQQWLALMGTWPDSAPTSIYGLGDHHPAYYINWNDAKAFITALNNHIITTGQGPATVRLPSESEWEYSCRAGTQTRFYFGDSLSVPDDCSDDDIRTQYMWYCGNNVPNGAKPVGRKMPNSFGLYDMHGNVWEWCEDDWHDNYNGAPDDGSAWLDNPRASSRTFRGGGAFSNAEVCRSAYRIYYSLPSSQHYSLGFRLAAVRQ